MNEAKRLFGKLVSQGFQLHSLGDKLEVSGPVHLLTDKLRSEISLARDGLFQLIEELEERIAIQREHEATVADIEFPTFDGVRNRQVPCGWAISEWRPAVKPQTQHADELEASGVSVTRTSGRCELCDSHEEIVLPIHDGASLRRDCASCGHFEAFDAWYDVELVATCIREASNAEKQDASRRLPRDASNRQPLL